MARPPAATPPSHLFYRANRYLHLRLHQVPIHLPDIEIRLLTEQELESVLGAGQPKTIRITAAIEDPGILDNQLMIKIIRKIRDDLHLAAIHLPADAMLDRVLDQRLKHHRRHRLIERVLIDVIFQLQPVFETDMLQRQLILYDIQLLFECHRLQLLRLHTAPQDIAQFGDGGTRTHRVLVDQRPDTVQGIENKMRVDMRFDRFQLQLLDQRLQFESIHLLLAADQHIVIQIIDQRPGYDHHPRVRRQREQARQEFRPLVRCQPQPVRYPDPDQGTQDTGRQHPDDEPRCGLFQCHQCPAVTLDHVTEEMGDEDPRQHRDDHYLYLSARYLLVERRRIQHQHHGQRSPTANLAPPIIFTSVFGHIATTPA